MIKIFDELRDPWAIAMAQVTAVFAFLVGASALQVVAAFVLVLAVKVIAGLTLPGKPTIFPVSILTDTERRIAQLIGEDVPLERVPSKMGLTTEEFDKAYQSLLEKLEYRDPWDVRKWAITVGLVPRPVRPSRVRRVVDSTLVRATLTAGGLIGMSWTLFQVYRYTCPSLQTVFTFIESCPP